MLTLSTLENALADQRAYHHGDLRNACIDCALSLLETQGLEGLTLRAVAQRAGVSRSAPYRHFPTKRDLTAAVAAAGFRLLTREIQQAMDAQAHCPLESLLSGVDAYSRFGMAYPCLYRLMFASDLGKGPLFDETDALADEDAEFPELAEAGTASYQVLIGNLEKAQRNGLVHPQNPREQALCVWSTLHGLLSLYIDNRSSYADHDMTAFSQVSRRSIRMILFGMSPAGAMAND
jgi:AcrR family transcriptional regulator